MSVTPTPAATLVIVKDSADGPLVLLQQRSAQARFVAGAWVFPGGKLEQGDSDPRWAARSHTLDDASASQMMGVPGGGLAYWIAAIRESFEEAGLLPLFGGGWRSPATLNEWRAGLTDQRMSFQQLCETQDLTLHTSHIHYLSHWITPEFQPIRFDTRFFIMEAPDGQEPHHALFEAVDTRWMRPETALQRHREGDFPLILPTLITLQTMAGHANCHRLIAHLLQSPMMSARPGLQLPGLQ